MHYLISSLIINNNIFKQNDIDILCNRQIIHINKKEISLLYSFTNIDNIIFYIFNINKEIDKRNIIENRFLVIQKTLLF